MTQVLVIDRDPSLRAALAYLRKAGGFSLALPEDEQAALTQVRQRHPDVILLDLQAPDVAGWPLAAQGQGRRAAERSTPMCCTDSRWQ